ncbi:MAG TPA: roadblock/LC7 domain-containing protein [Deinococcales bacterium]|nr:roadblock/LC7 domain-containing protein [Deinococcales bacterium]
MTIHEALDELAQSSGILSVALLARDGRLLRGLGADQDSLSAAASAAAAAFTAALGFSDFLGRGEPRQATLDCESGPLLVTATGADAGSPLIAVALDSMASLGRVRFQLRVLLPQVEQ